MSSNTSTNDATAIPPYEPDEYERTSYYHGIAGEHDHPILVYRSDFSTTPFPKPIGTYIPVKSLHGVFDSPLSHVWETVGPQIHHVLDAREIRWSTIDVVSFTTRVQPDVRGTRGPVVIWIGVLPDSTSSGAAHEASQDILALLSKKDIHDVVVEWREACVQRL